MSTDEVIKYDDPELVERREIEDQSGETITYWITSDGKLISDEHMARYEACTHRPCSNEDCDNYARKAYTICKECRQEKRDRKYREMDEEPWPEDNRPVMIYGGDTYFHDPGEFRDWCLDRQIHPEDVRLVHTESVGFPRVHPYWFFEDYIPRGQSVNDLDQEIWDAIDQLNEIIEKHAPYAYTQTDITVNVSGWIVETYEEEVSDADH